jgi:hypothetical protein
MPNSKISPTILVTTAGPAYAARTPRPSVAVRLTARLRARRFDDMLAVGAPAEAGSALAVHAARLVSPAERRALSRSLRIALTAADGSEPGVSMRAPLHRGNVNAAAGLIDTIAHRLDSPRPVAARGVARLRRVLSDGRGPLYLCGTGDLSGRLGAALAAL